MQRPGPHAPEVVVASFDETLAEAYSSFTVGQAQQKGAVVTVAYDQLYDPGTVSMTASVENIGNVGLDPVLAHDEVAIPLGSLMPGEIATKTLDFDYVTPGSYEVCFEVAEAGQTFDSRCVDFMVRAWDTLLAFPDTDKVIYARDETVVVSVTMRDASLQQVSFPHKLEIVTPSGDTSSAPMLTATEEGTYVVEATPQGEGYATVAGAHYSSWDARATWRCRQRSLERQSDSPWRPMQAGPSRGRGLS